MSFYGYLYMLSIFFLITSVGTKKNNKDFLSTTPHKIVKSKKLQLNFFLSYQHSFARGIFLTDTSIILTNNKDLENDYFFYEFSIASKKQIGKYVKFGTKVNEVLSPLSYGLSKDGSLFATDITLNKILSFSKKSTTNTNKETIYLKENALNDVGYSVQLIDSNTAIITGIEKSNNKVQIINIKTKEVFQSWGNYTDAPNNEPFSAWKQAIEGFIFLKPDGKKAVLGYRFTNKIEIFDLQDYSSILITSKDNFEPAFVPIRVSDGYLMQRTEQTRFAFVNGYCTQKFCYLLYSGEQHETTNKNKGKYIYKYDWTGKLVDTITLDRYITGFAISKDDNNIYAFDSNSKNVVFAQL
jgi:hypothetical protein